MSVALDTSSECDQSHEHDTRSDMKPDVDFASQHLVDSQRSTLLADHYDLSHLQAHSMQFQPRACRTEYTTDAPLSAPADNDGHRFAFDCEFESGNIGEVQHYKDNEYDIKIRGDSNNERHSIWFYFRVRGGDIGDKVVCHITNYSKNRSLYAEGFTPLIRSQSKPVWTRLPSNRISWFKCPRHRRNCFTFWFLVDAAEEEYFCAYSYPYTYSYLQKFLSDIDALQLPFYKRHLLARSIHQRRLDCVEIREAAESMNTSQQAVRPCVVFSARVHPGETPSSYVIHGLIEFLLSEHESAVFLRKHLTFFIIPMLNPDGVFMGNYRATSLGFDLNRHWQRPDFQQHPTIAALKYLLRKLDGTQQLDLYMDLHAHSNATDGFMYCNESQPLTECDDSLRLLHEAKKMGTHYARNNLTSVFARLLDRYCNEYSFAKTKFCCNPKKAGSARRAMQAILSEKPVCYTLEVSFWRSALMASNNLYTKETYRNLGRCMMYALREMYTIPQNQRHELNAYRLSSKKLMKGDIRRRLLRIVRRNSDPKTNNSNDENQKVLPATTIIPSVPPSI